MYWLDEGGGLVWWWILTNRVKGGLTKGQRMTVGKDSPDKKPAKVLTVSQSPTKYDKYFTV